MINMKRVDLCELAKEDSLKNLLEEYLRRSEELERRESKVMKQMEMMKTAVTSLMEWSESRKPLESERKPGRASVSEIEEETRQIKAETKRIQEEVRQKTEDNKKLEEMVKMRKIQRSEAEFFVKKFLEQREEVEGRRREEPIRTPALGAPRKEDAGLRFFQDKLARLMELEERLRRESDEEWEQARVREWNLKKKMENLERDLEIDRRRILCLKGKADGTQLPKSA